MIKLYIKKNPNLLAELGFPNGLLKRNILCAFLRHLCKLIRHKEGCQNCNFCSKLSNIWVEDGSSLFGEKNNFYGGKFLEKDVYDAVEHTKKYYDYQIISHLRMEDD